MPEMMRAAVLTQHTVVELRQVPRPALEPGEALIRVEYCGICGSDVGIAYGHAHGYPLILGHEFSGVVEQVAGEQGQELVGTAVTAAPLLSCGRCDACRRGQPQACGQYRFLGSSVNGAMAEYVKVPVSNLLPLEGLTMEEGALIEPLTIAIHAVRRVRPGALHRTVVLGAGPIGLLTALAAKALGAGEVLMLDVDQHKVDFARALGLEAVNSLAEDPAARGAAEASAVFECAAAQASVRSALALAGYGGTVVLVGISKKDMTLTPEDLRHVLKKELVVTGAWLSRYVPWQPEDDWRLARDLIARGEIPARKLITSEGTLEEFPGILEELYRRPGGGIKTLIRCGQ